jgi:hypothetical protein
VQYYVHHHHTFVLQAAEETDVLKQQRVYNAMMLMRGFKAVDAVACSNPNCDNRCCNIIYICERNNTRHVLARSCSSSTQTSYEMLVVQRGGVAVSMSACTCSKLVTHQL